MSKIKAFSFFIKTSGATKRQSYTITLNGKREGDKGTFSLIFGVMLQRRK